MEHGLIAVRIYDDGRHVKVCKEVGDALFGDGKDMLDGEVFERDGVKWFTPGNGCPDFTVEMRQKMIAEFKARGVDAEDWTAIGEWQPGDDYQKNDAALREAGLNVKGVVETKVGNDGKLSTAVRLSAIKAVEAAK